MTGKFLLRKFHLGKFHLENSSYGKFLLMKKTIYQAILECRWARTCETRVLNPTASEASQLRNNIATEKRRIFFLLLFFFGGILVGGILSGGILSGNKNVVSRVNNLCLQKICVRTFLHNMITMNMVYSGQAESNYFDCTLYWMGRYFVSQLF